MAFRILTWNTQGERWGSIKQRLDYYKPDVFCIQEAGNLPRAAGYPNQVTPNHPTRIAVYGDYNVWFVQWDRQGGGGNVRCSLAMIFADDGAPAVSSSNDAYKRPLMRKTVGSRYVVNIHAGGRQYVNEAIQHAKVNSGARGWIVTGDFNQNASENTQWMDKRGGSITAPNKPTRPSSGKILDYAVSSEHLAAASVCGPNYGGSDHRCVIVDW